MFLIKAWILCPPEYEKNSDIGSVTISEKEAMDFKKDIEDLREFIRKNIERIKRESEEHGAKVEE